MIPLSEKYLNRLDYWKMVADGSEEGSGTRAVALRMVEKYSIKRAEALEKEYEEQFEALRREKEEQLAARQREWEERHEKGNQDRMGAEGSESNADAGTGDGILPAGEPI